MPVKNLEKYLKINIDRIDFDYNLIYSSEPFDYLEIIITPNQSVKKNTPITVSFEYELTDIYGFKSSRDYNTNLKD